MGKFTPICQRYTDVMAHKHYLQHLLFDGTLNDATIIIKLTVVIIKLQFMANSLQTAQVCMCVLICILIQIMIYTYCNCRWKVMAMLLV